MNRFSVIYLLKKQYHHIYCTTQTEADSLLRNGFTDEGVIPIGIYDAKTELFYWEPTRQRHYDKATIEKQGKLGSQIITIAQGLRQRDNEWKPQTNSISQLLSM